MSTCQRYTAVRMLVTEKIIKDVSSSYIFYYSFEEVISVVIDLRSIGKKFFAGGFIRIEDKRACMERAEDFCQ